MSIKGPSFTILPPLIAIVVGVVLRPVSFVIALCSMGYVVYDLAAAGSVSGLIAVTLAMVFFFIAMIWE